MKRRGLILLGALAALTFGLALAGCSHHRMTVDDLIAMGYVHRVTFDFVDGSSVVDDEEEDEKGEDAEEGEDEEDEKEETRDKLVQYVKDGSLIIEPGTEFGTGSAPTREGYTFNAYYRGSEDGQGNITYGERWDFAADRVTEDITLYARWYPNYTLTVHFGENYAQTQSFSVRQSNEGVPEAVESVSLNDNTVLDGFYRSAEDARAKQNAVSFPYTPQDLAPPPQENTVTHLWANTLEGYWELVDDAADLTTISEGLNVYILNDIDFAGKTLSFPDNYAGEFNGNGFTLSNFTVTQGRANARTQSYGIFRELTASAYVHDVTFENVTYTGQLTNSSVIEYRAGILAGSALSGARVTNVQVVGGKFTYVIEDKFMEDVFPGDVPVLIGGDPDPEAVDTSGSSFSGIVFEENFFKWTPEEAEANQDNTENSES